MAGRRMIPSANAPAGDRLAAYIADLDALLRGPRHSRDAILAELADGLEHAFRNHAATGMTADRAAAAAIAEFGDPRVVAEAFSGELATASARRTIAALVATGPLIGIWWLLLRQPDPWRTGPTALFGAIPALPLIVIAIAASGGVFAATGRLTRWLPEAGPHRAVAAASAIATLCVAVDLIMITTFALSGAPTSRLAIIAIAASLIRIAVCARGLSGRRARVTA
jgi:hypothetical protein